MLELRKKNDFKRLRRVALTRQGLGLAAPFGRGKTAVSKMIRHLGYVQIDTISVVERAHYHVCRSRVPNFEPNMLARLVAQRDIFEYWSHAAAFLPMQDYRFSLPYKNAIKAGKVHWFKTRDEPLMAELLKRIEDTGPLRSRDLESGQSNAAGWWEWKPAKRALEQLYMQGDLMVSAREGFEKTYDLAERVLPDGIDQTPPTALEYAEYLLSQGLACHGFASLKGLTYLRRNADLRQAMKQLVTQGVAQGDLIQFKSKGEVYVSYAGFFDEPMPRINNAVTILSPFDNSLIQRDRLASLFEFDYQIECYVPEAKRQFGYFCLPLLWGDEFVGRMDCKAHRKSGTFEIKHLYLEPASAALKKVGWDEWANLFALAVRDFATFQNCSKIKISRVTPSTLASTIKRACSEKDQ